MISIYITYITMQIRLPLHTCQVDCHKFTTSYMVSGLCGGEHLAIECHSMPSLWELTTHSHHRSIARQVERLLKVGQSQHKSWCWFQLQWLKCSLLFIPPHKFILARQQVADRCSNLCKVGYKPIIVVGKTQKLLKTFDINRGCPVTSSGNLVQINTQFTWPNNMAKTPHVRFTKLALFDFACNFFSRNLANTLHRCTLWSLAVVL